MHIVILAAIGLLAVLEARRTGNSFKPSGIRQGSNSLGPIQQINPGVMATRSFDGGSGRPSGAWGVPPATQVPPAQRVPGFFVSSN
jgi:hypothetical protein